MFALRNHLQAPADFERVKPYYAAALVFEEYTPAEIAALPAMPLFATDRLGTHDNRKDVHLKVKNFRLMQRHLRLYVAEAKAALAGQAWPALTPRQAQHVHAALDFAEKALAAADTQVLNYVPPAPRTAGASAAASATPTVGLSAASAASSSVASTDPTTRSDSDDDGDSDDEATQHAATGELCPDSDDDEGEGGDGW